MIEIIQAGQSGKTESLIDMHRVRKFIFKDRMGWDVDISPDGLEIDDFDLPEAVYILVRDEKSRVSGVWRMLPTTSPSMIRNIWPQFLEDFSMAQSNDAWEVSRFGVYTYDDDPRAHIRNVSKITAQLISTLLGICTTNQINDIYTMYNPQVGRSVSKIGFIAAEVSQERPVDGKPSIVGRFRTDQNMRQKIQKITGIDYQPSYNDLPPILQKRFDQLSLTHKKEVTYA